MKQFSPKLSNIYIGNSFVDDLHIFLSDFIDSEIILITGKKSFTESPYFEMLQKVLHSLNITLKIHEKVASNPSEVEVQSFCKKSNLTKDNILAIGGGSVIDFAKLVKNKHDDIDLYVIYTLPGSASIVTPFTVYDNKEFKIGLYDKDIIPKSAYIPMEILEGISLELKLIAISDICAHAIESYLSKESTEESKKFAVKALDYLLNSKPGNMSMNDVISADICAGLSERIGLVLFPHAAGHYLTYQFGVTHGLATMFYLKPYIDYLYTNCDTVSENWINYVNDLYNILFRLGLIKEPSLTAEEAEKSFTLIERYMPFSLNNSPVNISKQKYLEFLTKK